MILTLSAFIIYVDDKSIFYFNNETGEDLSEKAEPKDSGSFRPILAF